MARRKIANQAFNIERVKVRRFFCTIFLFGSSLCMKLRIELNFITAAVHGCFRLILLNKVKLLLVNTVVFNLIGMGTRNCC